MRPRNRVASTIKNIQVPAYEPVLAGVQAVEYRGVEDEIWKTDIIDVDESDEDIELLENMSMSITMDLRMSCDLRLHQSGRQRGVFVDEEKKRL